MKKLGLCAGVMSFMSATLFAAATNQPTPNPAPGSPVPAPQPAGIQKPMPVAPAPTNTTTIITTPATTAPATTAPATTAPATTAPATTNPAPQAPAVVIVPKPLDCHFRIPAETTHIENDIVLRWAEKATVQSFDFDHTLMDKQLSDLKACYTDQGWQGFNDALQKSGNLNAIKNQQLMVSAMVNGESKISEIKDNQWKVNVPLQVVYQNSKEKLTQPLTVNLVIGRKISGDLGIMQMIAIPQNTTSPTATGRGQMGTPAP